MAVLVLRGPGGAQILRDAGLSAALRAAEEANIASGITMGPTVTVAPTRVISY